MTTLLHLVFAAVVHGLAFALLRGPARGGLPLEDWAVAFVRLVALGGAGASACTVLAGLSGGRRREMLARDALAMAALALPLAFALLRGSSRDEAGIVLAVTLGVRFAPVGAAVVSGALSHTRALAVVAFALYAPFAAWTVVTAYAQGDQPHFLLAAESLRRGELDLTPLYTDGTLFAELSGAPPTPEDLETHALALAVAFRLATTRMHGRPFAAGLAAGATFLLTPRDALTAGLLLAWCVMARRRWAVPLAAGMGAMAIVAAVVDQVTLGVPLPFAGYVSGLFTFAQARESALWLRPDLGVLGMLFDRAFGLAGSAPWTFVGAFGVVALLRAEPRRASALLAGAVGTLAGLGFYRLWEGGWSPPNRYLVDVLPLWTPFVGAALAVARAGWERALLAVLIAWSVLATIAFLGVPTWSYSAEDSRLSEQLRALPFDPLAALPSFHVPGASPLPAALALLVALLALGALGSRRRVATT